MAAFKQSLRRIPFWAYFLVFTVICVDTIYMIYRYQGPFSGETGEPVNGHWIINFNMPGGPVDRSGIKVGDTLISCNGYPVEKWVESYHGTKSGDTLIFGILKNNKEVGIPVIIDSKMSVFPGLYWSIYLAMLFVSIGSLYLLYKKKNDSTTLLFFIYIQLFAIAANAGNIIFPDGLFVFANLTYIFCMCLMGPVLIHFHLLFPRPLQILPRIKFIPALFYFFGTVIFIYSAISYYFDISLFSGTRFQYNLIDRLALFWMTLTFIMAMVVVVYQLVKVKSTLSRNQMLIVFIGSFFGFLTPILYGIFYNSINHTVFIGQFQVTLSQTVGSFIMIGCILIAIFRYRIWDMEIIIRKALLYMGATVVIILSYLLLIGLVNQFIPRETNLTRFVILAISLILFLVLRDHIQRLIDRIFHRETYDSATVVFDFEAKLAGIYRFDELKEKIVQSMDEIFHFKSFVFNLQKKGLVYEPAFVYGTDKPVTGSEYEINPELEEKLRKSQVFSPEELNQKSPILEETHGELVVPLISEGQPGGFFICGQKKSERIYSRQDIQVLSLLGRRVIALLHTASLYQKDLNRQLMLERERTRISQDMHDDVGASLTRIAILSELAKNNTEITGETRQWLGQISDTSRGVVEEMSQIIWALNPKNDTLEGLITYIRRFAGEYLESTPVQCSFELQETLPQLPLSVEVRRNIYLVVREALHNVVKHSGATKVIIDLTPQPPLLKERGRLDMKSLTSSQFAIAIRDNGKGFDPEKQELPGNGLINMRKRMHDIGGSIHIRSEVGGGTEILLIGDANPRSGVVP